jgi:hypothetical protein
MPIANSKERRELTDALNSLAILKRMLQHIWRVAGFSRGLKSNNGGIDPAYRASLLRNAPLTPLTMVIVRSDREIVSMYLFGGGLENVSRRTEIQQLAKEILDLEMLGKRFSALLTTISWPGHNC